MTGNDADFRYILTELAEKLAEQATLITGVDEYDSGRKMAYFEAIETILELCAETGVNPAEIGLGGYDPAPLVGLRRRS